MKRRRFTEDQIIGILKEHEAGIPVADLCRKHGVSNASIYKWKARYGGMDVSEASPREQRTQKIPIMRSTRRKRPHPESGAWRSDPQSGQQSGLPRSQRSDCRTPPTEMSSTGQRSRAEFGHRSGHFREGAAANARIRLGG
jgi:transposase-like protein